MQLKRRKQKETTDVIIFVQFGFYFWTLKILENKGIGNQLTVACLSFTIAGVIFANFLLDLCVLIDNKFLLTSIIIYFLF